MSSASSEIVDFWKESDTTTDSPSISNDRQITVSDKAPFDSSTENWEEKVRICKMVGDTPSGLSLYGIVSRLDGISTEEAGRLGSDNPTYQRVRRFVNGNPDFFEVEDLSGVNIVYPGLELLSLIFGGIVQNPSEEAYTPGLEFCENLLKSVRPTREEDSINFHWDDSKWYLRQAFEDYLSRINDLRIILQAEDPEISPEYLSLPYRTRFNDEGRVRKQWAVMDSMIEKAGEWYDTAAFTTLTTKPSHFDNLYEAIAEINTNFNRLMSWLQTDSRLGYRPDYLKVLEFQDSGNPHLHVIFFLEQDNDGSMPWLVDKSDLDDYWAKWQGGYINDIQPLVWQDNLSSDYEADSGWVKWQEDGNHGGLLDGDRDDDDEDSEARHCQTAGQYLGKYLSATFGTILDEGTDADVDGHSGYNDKSEMWKIAMYWATGRKIKTCSQDLRDAVEVEFEDDVESEIVELIQDCRYTVVGSFQEAQIPPHIYHEAVRIEHLLDHAGEGGSSPDSIPDRMRPVEIG